jgi:hypothetical protein
VIQVSSIACHSGSRISGVEWWSVEKLKSVESMLEGDNIKTSLTGHPGMSIPSREGWAITRVRSGRHLSSNGGKGS